MRIEKEQPCDTCTYEIVPSFEYPCNLCFMTTDFEYYESVNGKDERVISEGAGVL